MKINKFITNSGSVRETIDCSDDDKELKKYYEVFHTYEIPEKKECPSVKYAPSLELIEHCRKTENALRRAIKALDEISHITIQGLKMDAADGMEPRDWKYYACTALAEIEKIRGEE